MNQDTNVDYYAASEEAVDKVTSNSPSWTGEVDGYAIKQPLEFHANGAAIITFHQPADEKGYTNKLFINPVDFEQVTPYGEETKDAAIIKALSRELRMFKQLARNYTDEETVNAAFKGANSFQQRVEALNNCLPADVANITGRAVVGYNNKGYLSFPNRLQWDNESRRWLPFFSTDPDQKLCDLPNNFTLNKVQPNTEVGEGGESEEIKF